MVEEKNRSYKSYRSYRRIGRRGWPEAGGTCRHGNNRGIAGGDACLNRFLDRLEMTSGRWNGIWERGRIAKDGMQSIPYQNEARGRPEAGGTCRHGNNRGIAYGDADI